VRDRYKGFSALLDAFRILGFLDSTPLRGLSHWSDFLAAVLGSKSKDWDSLRSQVNNKLNNWDGDSNEFWETLKWYVAFVKRLSPGIYSYLIVYSLSLTPDTYHNSLVTSLPSIPKESTALDLFTSLLSHKLRYGPGERDMVILSHEMTSVPLTPTYSLTRAASTVHTSTMVTYSDAMARTVGLPIAFGALRVLDGLVKERGVKMPVDEEVYEGVLSELERVGIKIGERTMESGFLCRL
jgi:alpha-aminoadipic semialdehyde synthase